MATMDSGFASGWAIIQLIYLQSCVTLLYQILFTRGIDFWGQFGDSRLIYRSNVKFKVILVKECSTTGHVHMFLTLKTSSPQHKTSQHEPLTVFKKLFNLCSLDGDTSNVQRGHYIQDNKVDYMVNIQ